MIIDKCCDNYNFIFAEKNGPSMYLDFENATSANIITDKSGHGNDAVLLKGAKLSSRKLGE